MLRNPLILHIPWPKQMLFLELECLDALYGGAAGGAKSDALLMAALQFAEVPGYSALLLRRTFADLALPGALMDRSHEWLRGKAKWNGQDHRWRFANGAGLQFGYCDNEKDVERYRGAEFQFIGLDEATQFTEKQIKFLFSRLRRRRTIPVPLRFRLASNPGGPAHTFVKARYIDPGTPGKTFIKATLKDNPTLSYAEYARSLDETDPITRAQLLAGDWDAIEGGRFLRQWFRYYRVEHLQFGQGGEYNLLRPDDNDTSERFFRADQCWRFMTVDPAASDKTAADWTVISVWGVTPNYQLLWLDMHRFKLRIPDIVPQIQSVYSEWRPEYVAIEAVASNRAILDIASRTSMVTKEVSPRVMGHMANKLLHATKALNMAAAGRVYLPQRAHWLQDVTNELLLFTGDEKKDDHDDIVDTLSYAAACLDEHDSSDAGEAMTLGGRAW